MNGNQPIAIRRRAARGIGAVLPGGHAWLTAIYVIVLGYFAGASWADPSLVRLLPPAQTRSGQPARSAQASSPFGPPPIIRRLPPPDAAPASPTLPPPENRLLHPLESVPLPSTPPQKTQAGETLEQAWAIALAADHRLQAHHHYREAAGQRLGSVQAERLPSLLAQTGYHVRDDEAAFRFNVPGLPITQSVFPYQQREGYSLRTTARLPLYTGGRLGNQIHAAQRLSRLAELDLLREQLDVRLRVAEAYVQILRHQGLVQVEHTAVESIQSHARDVRLAFEQGRATRNDLLTVQVRLSSARQDLVQAECKLDMARAAYNRQLARPLSDPVQLEPIDAFDARQLTALSLTELSEMAAHQRPEVEAMAVRAAARRHDSAAARAKYLPEVALEGSYAFQENRFQEPEGIASVGVGLSWVPLDGGRGRRQSQAIAAEANAIDRLRRDQEWIVRLEVRDAFNQLGESLSRIDATRVDMEMAEENLRVARSRYAMGTALSTEVLDAETLRHESSLRHDDSVYDAVLAAFRLMRAVGNFQLTTKSKH